MGNGGDITGRDGHLYDVCKVCSNVCIMITVGCNGTLLPPRMI